MEGENVMPNERTAPRWATWWLSFIMGGVLTNAYFLVKVSEDVKEIRAAVAPKPTVRQDPKVHTGTGKADWTVQALAAQAVPDLAELTKLNFEYRDGKNHIYAHGEEVEPVAVPTFCTAYLRLDGKVATIIHPHAEGGLLVIFFKDDFWGIRRFSFDGGLRSLGELRKGSAVTRLLEDLGK